MRIFPLVLVAIGVYGLLQHFGFIDPAFVHLLWPLLLIGLGLAMLVRGPRWRADMRERMHERRERDMHRHGGRGAELSEEERERFRSGMRQRRCHGRTAAEPSAPASATDDPAPGRLVQAPARDEPR